MEQQGRRVAEKWGSIAAGKQSSKEAEQRGSGKAEKHCLFSLKQKLNALVLTAHSKVKKEPTLSGSVNCVKPGGYNSHWELISLLPGIHLREYRGRNVSCITLLHK